MHRKHMTRQNMVEKGNSKEQAETELGLLFTLADCLDQADLSLSVKDGRPEANLKIKLKSPGIK